MAPGAPTQSMDSAAYSRVPQVQSAQGGSPVMQGGYAQLQQAPVGSAAGAAVPLVQHAPPVASSNANMAAVNNMQLETARGPEPIARSPFALPGASLSFKDLGFSVQLPDGSMKAILEPCTGHFEPGNLVALMGPSGCGKSTLLDMLAMKKTAKYQGDIYINGKPRDARLFRRIAAYVGQEDVMPQHWKVKEAIRFNAALKMPGLQGKGHDDVCGLLLEAFGLSGVADTYVGGPQVRGISGGQRRRVTLARGVAAQASLLFCDEPTSGLSATDAELCVKALRVIAKRLGVLVLVVIHQPRIEIAEMFDTLVLLTANPGRVLYFGPMSESTAWMRACGKPVPPYVNPTDYFLDLVTPGLSLDSSDMFVSEFQSKVLPDLRYQVRQAIERGGPTIKEMLKQTAGASNRSNTGKYAVGFATQFGQLLRRKITITLRNPLAIGLPLILPLFMGIVVGVMFLNIGSQGIQNQIAFIFIMLTILGLVGIQLMPILIDERHFMKYETSEALYSEGASALASFCVDVPLAFMGCAYEVLVMYTIAGMESEYLPDVFFWAMLLFLTYDSLFGCVAAIAEDTQSAQALATPIISIFMLFNGFVITKANAPHWLAWLFFISPNGYAMQAIVIKIAAGFGAVGQFAVSYAGLKDDENLQGVLVMCASIALLRIGQLFALRNFHNIQK